MRNLTTTLLYLFILPMFIFPCSAINKTVGGKTIFGGNFDWMNPYIEVAFAPGEEGKNGVIYMTIGGGICTGINDKGLAMDNFTVPYREIKSSPQKEDSNDSNYIFSKILEECSTVDEALSILEKYNRWFNSSGQFMIVDKSGKSIIVEANNTVKKEGEYQIVTNFNVSEYPEGNYPCIRYNKGLEMVDKIDFTINGFESILNSMKQPEGSDYPTIYSYIFDLSKGEFHLYNFGDFNNKVIFNIEEELGKGYRSILFSSLLKNKDYENYLTKYLNSKPKRKKISTKLNDYSGTYQFREGGTLELVVNKGKLYIVNTKYEVIPFRKDCFFFEELDYLFVFKRNKSGEVFEVLSTHTVFENYIAKKIN